MSVSSVSGGSQQWDLVNAMRQARAAAAQSASVQADAPSQSDATPAGSANAAPAGSSGSPPNLSSDMLASLFQFQSATVDPAASIGSDAGAPDAATGTGAVQTADGGSGAQPVRHHHHHGGPPPADAGNASRAGGDASTAASAMPDATGDAASRTGQADDGLSSLFQQLTKAAAAYATGGPAGLAASALGSTALMNA